MRKRTRSRIGFVTRLKRANRAATTNHEPTPHEPPRERMCGAVDDDAFAAAIRDNLSPDGIATAIAFLRAAESGNRPTEPRAIAALCEVEWLADTLTDLLGVDEHNRLMDELGL